MRARCTIHGSRCPLGSHAADDDSTYYWDDGGYAEDQQILDDADAAAGWDR